MDDFISKYKDLGDVSEREKLRFLLRKQTQFAVEAATESEQQPQRRQKPRADMRQEITVQSGDETQTMETVNLGFGGAKIAGKCPVAQGEMVTAGLRHQDLWGAAIAQVMRVDSDGFVIKFLTQSQNFTFVLVEIVTPELEPNAWEKCQS